MPQIQITVSDGVLNALQSRAQSEGVSVIDLIRCSLVELTDDGVSDDVRAIIEKSIRANKWMLDKLAEGPGPTTTSMSADVILEFVGPERAAEVRALMLAAFSEYDNVLTVPSSAMAESVEDVAEHISVGGAVLATVAGQTVGSGRFELCEDHVYIGRLSVLPAHRGAGIGALMMTAMEQHAASKGFTEARIGVRTMLPKNIALYQRLGYEVTARYKHPRGDEVIVDMAKQLA